MPKIGKGVSNVVRVGDSNKIKKQGKRNRRSDSVLMAKAGDIELRQEGAKTFALYDKDGNIIRERYYYAGREALGEIIFEDKNEPLHLMKILQKNNAESRILENALKSGDYVPFNRFEKEMHLPYPGLTGWAYQAEMLKPEEGEEQQDKLISKASWIERDRKVGGFTVYMKNGTVLSTNDTDDWPYPTGEDLSDYFPTDE